MLGIPLQLQPPKERYMHGWGQACHDAKIIVSTWDLTVLDRDNKSTTFSFDLVNGSSPLVIGLDVGRFSIIDNICKEPHIKIHRPQDTTTYSFNTYIAPDSIDNPDCIRSRIECFPKDHKNLSTMLSKLYNTVQRDPSQFAKQVHRYTHVHPDQLKYLCDKAGILNAPLRSAIDNVDAACTLCVQHGRPLPSKKISLSHINEAFNEEVQIDFTYITIHPHQTNNPSIPTPNKITLIVITDTGTRYTECDISPQRNIETIISMYERLWICRHGASKRISADDEYNRKRLVDFFATHNIEFKPRPTRRHNKTGIVERKHAVIKNLIQRLAMEKSNNPIQTIVARATFFANLFSGSQILSSFELARGYQPSVLGLPSNRVTQDILNAHTEQMATRALQRVLRTNTPNTPTPGMFQPNDKVWVWYASSKNNEPNEWIPAKVLAAHTHYLEVRRIKNGQPCRGPTMKPAYEDVRIAPKGKLAQTLMEQTLETALGYDQSAERGAEDNMNEVSRPAISTMLTQVSTPKSGKDDIGTHARRITTAQSDIAETLKSEKARILDGVYDTIGSQQVSRSQLGFVEPWLLQQAFEKEYESNWIDAYELVSEKDVPANANIITSHCVYKVKTSEEGARDLKNRIVPHGNHDDEKDSIRKDSSTAQLSVIRLLLAIVTFLGLRMATTDIKGAYLQSGPIQRNIYVRPPWEWKFHKDYVRYALWKLIKLPYGIVEAGRQWQKVVEDWMVNEYKLERVFGVSQLFIKRDKKGQIVLIVAKVTDDFLIGGSKRQIKLFVQGMEQRFKVGKVVIDSKFHFNGCEIEQDVDGNIRMSMLRYLDRVKPINISRTRRKQTEDSVTPQEMKQYRALAGTLLYLGNGVLPQASLVVSLMQQRTPSLRVSHLIDANKMLKELLDLKPWVTFIKPRGVTQMTYCSFSDASHPRDRDYGQTGIVAGFRIAVQNNSKELFLPIYWTSQKQNRVSYSSYGAEILAAAAADDRGFYFKAAISSLFPHLHVRHELNVDSRALYDTITTLHEGTEYRLRPTVQRIRNSFESHELETIRWIPGKVNVADALTKRTMELSKKLNEMCANGVLLINLDTGYEVDSALWQ